ncbi:hypothetical protein [Polyangium aurulentum]|uniref:hypothetical protein n=1 Tax=Polyangium aurulentum TaxID=2567896 RepID=UPI0010ADB223|nr:hypothetical protein [Polyangium aurulentum]UQA58576.1 hypothetical protein E8A73_046300 [Polyangium aurulentum]
MRAVCLLVLALVGLAVLCRTAPAQAQLPPRIAVRLEYEPIPGMDCPSADDLHNYLMAQLGYDPIVETATSTLVVRLRKQGKVFEADSFVRDANGADLWHEPPIHNDMDCWEIAQDAARAVRIGLGPSAWPNRTPPVWLAAEPAPAPPPEASPPPTAAPPPVQTPTAGRGAPSSPSRNPGMSNSILRGVEVTAGISGAVLATPDKVAMGVEVGAAARFAWGSAGFQFRGMYGLTTPESVPIGSSLWAGMAILCVSKALPRGASVCGLAAATWLHTEIEAPYSVAHGDALYPAAGLRVMYDARLPGNLWFLRFEAEATVRLRQINIAVAEADTYRIAWTSKPIVPTIGLGIAKVFE